MLGSESLAGFVEGAVMRRTWIVVGCMLVLPAITLAQRAGSGGMRGAGAAVVASGPAAVGTVHMAGNAPHVAMAAGAGRDAGATRRVVRRVRTGGIVNRNVSTASRLNNLPVFSADSSVPGLGFDYPHLAAVNPARGRLRSGFGQGGAFGFGGFLMSPEIIVENPQAVEEAQQSAEEEGPANVVADGRDAQREYFPRTSPAPEPPRDDSEYVFVRRDGGLLFAVGYSWENGTLRYVTREGVRKSVTQDLLDMDATQQFNEQRGLNFRVPA
jgi:hypothetical protein